MAMPHSLHRGQPFMWVPRKFASFALSSSEVALCACVAVPHSLCTFSGQSIPASSTLFPSKGILHVCTPQWVCEAVPCGTTHWINLWVKGLLVCILWGPGVSAKSNPRRGGWGCAIAPCRLAREPGWSSCPPSTVQGKTKQLCSRVPLVLGCFLNS